MQINISDKLEALVRGEVANEKELLFRLKGIVYELESQLGIIRPSKSISELYSESNANLGEENPFECYKTCFADFDKVFGGFFMGELIVIGGRPSMGKTQLMVNLAVNLSRQVPVLFFTFDLSAFMLTNRIISHLTQIPIDRILSKQLSIEEQSIIAGLEHEISSLNIHINESGCNSVSGLKNLCEKHIKEDGVKVIFVDYIQLMSTSRYKNNRELEVGFISRELKNIAKDYGVCVIATSQLNRSVETRGGSKTPTLSDLRDSGAIEQDADKVILITRPSYYGFSEDEEGNSLEGVVKLIVAKNQNGRLGEIKLILDANLTTFSNFDVYNRDFCFLKNRITEISSDLNNDNNIPY